MDSFAGKMRSLLSVTCHDPTKLISSN